MMIFRRRRPDPSEAKANTNPYSLLDVTAEALVRKVASADAGPEAIFPGFVTMRQPDGVVISKKYSPSNGESISLHRNTESLWIYVHSVWRPGTELEPAHTIIRTTNRIPVSPVLDGSRQTELCYLNDDLTLRPFQIQRLDVLPPLDQARASDVALTLRSMLYSARQ